MFEKFLQLSSRMEKKGIVYSKTNGWTLVIGCHRTLGTHQRIEYSTILKTRLGPLVAVPSSVISSNATDRHPIRVE